MPHHLHEQLYLDVLRRGKISSRKNPSASICAAARKILAAVRETGRFVRCSSEFPFLPGAQRASAIRSKPGNSGRCSKSVSGFHHSQRSRCDQADQLETPKPHCGEIGVLGDLGMHAVPLAAAIRLEASVASMRSSERLPAAPDGRRRHDCLRHLGQRRAAHLDRHRRPGRADAPGNEAARSRRDQTWFIEVLGTEGGVRYSTKQPKTLWLFERGKEQWWQRTDLGFGMPFKAVTGGIFEPGFPDVIQQMWAAFLMEREGKLGGRFGCVTPDEAVASHQIFAAACGPRQTGRSRPCKRLDARGGAMIAVRLRVDLGRPR